MGATQQALLGYGGGGFDPDAEAFFTAACITDDTQKAAWNTAVVDLIDAAIWDKFHILYPWIGGTAESHLVNAKTPGTFDMTWVDTVTHNENGITPNGTTGYGNTGYTPSTHGVLNDLHMSLYSRTATNQSNTFDMGCQRFTPNYLLRLSAADFSNFKATHQAGVQDTVANTDGRGLFVISRTDSVGFRMQMRGINNNKTQASAGNPDFPIFIGALNNGGSATGFSPRNLAFASVGLGLSAAEAGDLDTIVTAFQTALGRAV